VLNEDAIISIMKTRYDSKSLSEAIKWYQDKFDSQYHHCIDTLSHRELWRFAIDGEKQYGAIKKILDELESLRLSARKPVLSIFQKYDDMPFPDITLNEFANNIDKIQLQDKSTLYDLSYALRCYVLDNTSGLYDPQSATLAKKISVLAERDTAWVPFENREPGYLKSMYSAFSFMLKHVHEPLTIDTIKQLHLLAMKDTRNTEFDNDELNRKGEFRFTATKFGISQGNCSLAGYKQIIDEINRQRQETPAQNLELLLSLYSIQPNIDRKSADRYRPVIINALSENTELNYYNYGDDILSEEDSKKFDFSELVYDDNIKTNSDKMMLATLMVSEDSSHDGKKTNNAVTRFMQYLLTRYERQMSQGTNIDEKLEIIIKFIQDCEQLHPFVDGNCRVFCMLILNLLLMQNNMPPVILNNPNQFDGFSRVELKAAVIQGMNHTIHLIEEGYLYDVSTDEVVKHLTNEEKKYFDEIISIEMNQKPGVTH
jgi:hypothetical protein